MNRSFFYLEINIIIYGDIRDTLYYNIFNMHIQEKKTNTIIILLIH